MIKTYQKWEMPWKLTLIHKTGKKYVFYKSKTVYLSYDERVFTATSESRSSKKQASLWEKPKVQIL